MEQEINFGWIIVRYDTKTKKYYYENTHLRVYSLKTNFPHQYAIRVSKNMPENPNQDTERYDFERWFIAYTMYEGSVNAFNRMDETILR